MNANSIDKMRLARALVHAGSNVFVHGRAGTGKSQFLQSMRLELENEGKRVATLAPTGIAALNIGGQTIHKFAGLGTGVVRAGQGVCEHFDTIIVDEISMVRADIMAALRALQPKAQLIVVGDLYQLPPVVTERDSAAFHSRFASPFFFAGLNEPIARVELTHIFRQQEQDFIDALNRVREARCDAADLELFNSRVFHKPPRTTVLTPINTAADAVNSEQLARLPGLARHYSRQYEGDCADIECPAPGVIELKVGARVLFTANDPLGAYANGTTGTVVAMHADAVVVETLLQGPTAIRANLLWVEARSWDSWGIAPDGVRRRIGRIIQLPLRHAWATTIHKSQGLSLDRVHIDFGERCFAPSQAYVALSRCRSLAGLTLARPLRQADIFVDVRITNYLRREREMTSAALAPNSRQLFQSQSTNWRSNAMPQIARA